MQTLSYNHSTDGTRVEDPRDLAYRSALPRGLGSFLPTTHVNQDSTTSSGEEEYGLADNTASPQREATIRSAKWQALAPALALNHALLLGIRRIRSEYAEQIEALRGLRALRQPPAGPMANMEPISVP